MEPTVGRIVLYTPMEKQFEGNDSSPLPAVIVRVWGPNCVNLKVLADGPQDAWVTSVMLGTGPRTWAWPVRG